MFLSTLELIFTVITFIVVITIALRSCDQKHSCEEMGGTWKITDYSTTAGICISKEGKIIKL